MVITTPIIIPVKYTDLIEAFILILASATAVVLITFEAAKVIKTIEEVQKEKNKKGFLSCRKW